jgi:hypothetical protein
MPVHLTSRESLRMFDLADIWAARTGKQVRLVSANDHVHSRHSAHYLGLALDFQSSDPDGLSTTFRLAGYRVLWRVPGHFGHVHVEQDHTSGMSRFARSTNARYSGAVYAQRPLSGVFDVRAGGQPRRANTKISSRLQMLPRDDQ